MKSTYKTLLAKLNERVINHTTLKSVGEFAIKLIENHATDIKASAVMYGFGKLLKRFCLYEKVQFTNDLLQDAFPIIISEIDRALSGDRNMSKDAFKDLRGEYSDEQVSLVRVTCWNFINSLLDLLDEVNILDVPIEKSLFIEMLIEGDDLHRFIREPEEEIYKKFTACGLPASNCERMKRILEMALNDFPECINDIFYKQKLVLHNKLITFEHRVGATRLQLPMYNQCIYS